MGSWRLPSSDTANRAFQICFAKKSARIVTFQIIGKTLVKLGDYREAAVALERSIRYSSYVGEEDLSLLAGCLRKIGKERAANEVERTGNRLLNGEQKRSNAPSER